jgi:hypothetical protein
MADRYLRKRRLIPCLSKDDEGKKHQLIHGRPSARRGQSKQRKLKD